MLAARALALAGSCNGLRAGNLGNRGRRGSRARCWASGGSEAVAQCIPAAASKPAGDACECRVFFCERGKSKFHREERMRGETNESR
jgi:hypothetical protein